MNKKGFPLSEFPERLYATIKVLASAPKAQQNKEVQKMLPFFLRQAQTLKSPASSGIIMLDLWPSQFLMSENRISALIDIESYVVGPVELELVLIELWLQNLSPFKQGYFSQGTQWPDFEENRELYRFFLFLLYDCPEAGLKACLDSAAKFPQGDRVQSRMTSPRPRMPGTPSDPYNPFAR